MSNSVQCRLVPWHKITESYKNKQLIFAAWKEICTILKENIEIM